MNYMRINDDKSQRSTQILLAALDNEIEIKCLELKEKKRQNKLKRIFFFSCIAIMIISIVQILFKVFNFNIIFTIIFYQALVALITIFMIPNILKEGDT